jgi:hypothetical protein
MWQCHRVRKRPIQRCFIALGMLAMLGALISVPMSTSVALAMAAPATASPAHDQMPCHEPADPCPDCPQNICPDMGACLVHCFQPLSPAVAEARLHGTAVRSQVLPSPSPILAASLVPPLLRPPSV